MDEAKRKRGSRTWFQRTNRHSGGDQEQGPWITVKGLVTTVTMMQSLFLKGKRRTKQNPNPNVAAATKYMKFMVWNPPWTRP